MNEALEFVLRKSHAGEWRACLTTEEVQLRQNNVLHSGMYLYQASRSHIYHLF
jgi:hypothetical protein